MIILWNISLILCCFLQLSLAKVSGKGGTAVRLNITRVKIDGQYVNTNTYSIYPGDTERPFQQYETYRSYYVKNVGRAGVLAYVRIGNAFQWLTVVDSASVYSNEEKTLSAKGRGLYSQLVITNYGSQRAFMHCYVGNGYSRSKSSKTSWNFDLDMNNLMKKLVVFGTDYIPVVGPVISNVIDFFWPASSVDVWEEVKNKVTNLIDESLSELVENILNNKVRMFKKRIQTIAKEQAVGVRKRRIGDHYLNIAQDMIGLEEEFVFDAKKSKNYAKINYASLPLFSLVISMKIMFYRCGFDNPDALGLDEHDIQELKIYAEETLSPEAGKIQKHLEEVTAQRILHTYYNVDAENLFNEMANVKSYIAYNGEQYLAVWNDMVNGNKKKGKPYNPVLFYPSYVGTSTANLLALGGTLPLLGGLTPPLTNGTRASIKMIWTHTYKNNIVGLKLIYSDDSELKSGLLTNTILNSYTVEPYYLKKLDIYGDFPNGIVRGIHFINSRGEVFEAGTTTKTMYTMEMEGKHVAAIHISTDMGSDNDEAWNVAASFEPDCIDHK